jgi:hypothetical protein
VPATAADTVRGLWTSARERPTRLAPGHLPLPLRVVAVVCWATAAAMLVLAFLPDVFAKAEHSIYGGELVFGYSPIWPLLLGIAIGSGCAATGFAYSATRPDAPRYGAVLAWCAAVLVPAVPVLLLVADRSGLAIAAGIAWLAGATLLIVTVHVRRRAPSAVVGVLLAALTALPWAPAIVANLRLGLVLSADPLPADEAVLHLLLSDLSATTYVPGLAVAFVATMTAAGVALAAHSRAGDVDNLPDRHRTWRGAAVVCAIGVVVIALEVAGFAGISSGFIDEFWSLDDPWAWPHAIVVAAAVAFAVQRSFHVPLRPRGGVAATLAVGVGVLSVPITLALILVANVIANAVDGPEHAFIGPPAGLELLILWLALACLVPMATLRRTRGTLGRTVASVSLLYLVPVYLGITASQLGFHVIAVFWASPAQVVMCLVAICCAATLSGAVGRSAPLPPDAVVRLVAIPLLIITVTSWVPSAIAVPLTPIVAVGAALFTLLWAMPPAATERDEHSAVVLTASAQLLLVGACAVIVVCLPDVTPDDPTLAVLLLAVPLSTLLCARVTGGDDDGSHGSGDRALRPSPGVASP